MINRIRDAWLVLIGKAKVRPRYLFISGKYLNGYRSDGTRDTTIEDAIHDTFRSNNLIGA